MKRIDLRLQYSATNLGKSALRIQDASGLLSHSSMLVIAIQFMTTSTPFFSQIDAKCSTLGSMGINPLIEVFILEVPKTTFLGLDDKLMNMFEPSIPDAPRTKILTSKL